MCSPPPQIEMPDGYQLTITVERSTPPNMPVTEELMEKIKVKLRSAPPSFFGLIFGTRTFRKEPIDSGAVQNCPQICLLEVVMSGRYIVENKALNLAAFHADEGFAGEAFYAPLWRSNVMNKVQARLVHNSSSS